MVRCVVFCLSLFALAGVLGCGTREPSAPSPVDDQATTTTTEEATAVDAQVPPELRKAVAEIIVLLEQKNYQELVEKYYGDYEQVKKEGREAQLLERYKESVGNTFLQLLKNAQHRSPQLSPDGWTAVYQAGKEKIVFKKNTKGQWLYHL